MKLSIIVPVYNVEAYLRECIDSLIQQTYQELEIILVDDGSTDKSPEICDKYEKEDCRIKVIHKINGGVSSARNTGIAAASGDYVLFVDADDWLDQDTCQRIVNQIPDDCVLAFGNSNIAEEGSLVKQKDIMKPVDLPHLVADIIAGDKEQNPYLRAVWAKVYKRHLIENLKFDENLYIGEDACFLLECLNKIKSFDQVMIFQDSWYNYRILQASAVRRYKADLLQQSFSQYYSIRHLICKMRLQGEVCIQSAMTRFCWGIYFSLKANAMKKDNSHHDCNEWEKVTREYLINANIKRQELAKFQLLCWKLYPICGSRNIERLVGLYEQYRRWKNKHYHSSI